MPSFTAVTTVLPTCYIFGSKDEAQKSFPGEEIVSKTVADPSFDPSFFSVLSVDDRKKKFVVGFLNSIYFPDADNDENGFKIREIEALDDECLKDCCVVCKCCCHAADSTTSQQISFDIELRRDTSEYYLGRVMDYAYRLRGNGAAVRALGLLNWDQPSDGDPFVDESSCFTWKPTDPKTKALINPDDQNTIEANAIDLRMFSKSDDVYVSGKKLGILGVTWLKLFGLRQWCKGKEDKPYMYEVFYPEKAIDPLLKQAVDVFATLRVRYLDAIAEEYMYEEEDRKNEAARKAEEKASAERLAKIRAENYARGYADGRAEGEAKGFAEGRAKGSTKGEANMLEKIMQLVTQWYTGEELEKISQEFKRAVYGE